MLKRFFCLFILFAITLTVNAQADLTEKLSKTYLYNLKDNDSLTYYQCRVVKAALSINDGSTTLNTKEQTLTITEKFVIKKLNGQYIVRNYVSGLTLFPNRKFSGLKLREKAYWNFTFKSEKVLAANEINYLQGLQVIGKETTEYDFAITKYTTNQLIIKKKKDFEQLLLKEDVVISKALKLQ